MDIFSFKFHIYTMTTKENDRQLQKSEKVKGLYFLYGKNNSNFIVTIYLIQNALFNAFSLNFFF